MPRPLARGRGSRSRSRLGPLASQLREAESVPIAPQATHVGRGSLLGAKLPALVLLLGAIWMLYNLLNDDRFRVNRLEVHGVQLLRASDIQRSLTLGALPVVGQSIFRIAADGVERRLLQEYGCLDKVTVRCRLPNHVVIELSERQDLLVWESGGRFWWVDIKGNVLGEAQHPGELIVIHDVASWASDPRDHIVGVPWRLARDLAAAYPAIREYDYTREAGLILYVTDRRWPVYLGYQGEGARKFAILQALVQTLYAKGMNVAHIDLRNDRHPSVQGGAS